MISEILEIIRNVILGITIYERGFVSVDYNREGYFISAEENILNFDESYGTHFYLRTIDKITFEKNTNICKAAYLASVKCRLVAFLQNKKPNMETIALATVNMLGNAGDSVKYNSFNVSIISLDLDKYAILSEEIQDNVDADLTSRQLFSIDFYLNFTPKSCRLQDCCI